MLKDVLIKLRKLGNYSQEEVAERCNVSRQAVSKWEQGLSIPDIYNCQELCKLYNIDINELLESDSNDYQMLVPKDKFIFGYTERKEEGIVIPNEWLEAIGFTKEDSIICLGDKKQGIALVNAQNYEKFAEEIMNAKKGINKWK